MRTPILQFASVALFVLVLITGSISWLSAESTPGMDGTMLATSSLPSDAGAPAASGANEAAFVAQPSNEPSSAVASSVDLITAGACAALMSCCILVFALSRLRLRGGPAAASWSAVLRHTFSPAVFPTPLAFSVGPSLTLLSISRT